MRIVTSPNPKTLHSQVGLGLREMPQGGWFTTKHVLHQKHVILICHKMSYENMKFSLPQQNMFPHEKTCYSHVNNMLHKPLLFQPFSSLPYTVINLFYYTGSSTCIPLNIWYKSIKFFICITKHVFMPKTCFPPICTTCHTRTRKNFISITKQKTCSYTK